ncbi:hypothetical protein WDW37_12810 [Bdellovibrionota bacterium FG-1]
MSFRAALLFSLLLVQALAITNEAQSAPPSVWKTDWRYSATNGETSTTARNWKPTSVPCVLADPKITSSLWFAAPLPATVIPNPILYIRAMANPFRVYLGDRVLYEFGYDGGMPTSRFMGFPWHMISLPEDSAGKELRFVTNVTQAKSGFCSEMSIGPAVGFTARLAIDGIDRSLAALFALLCGIAGVIVFAATNPSQSSKTIFHSVPANMALSGIWSFQSGPIEPLYRPKPSTCTVFSVI